MTSRDERYERARAIYTEEPESTEDDPFARRVQAATVMWLFDKGEDGAAEKLLDLIDPPAPTT